MKKIRNLGCLLLLVFAFLLLTACGAKQTNQPADTQAESRDGQDIVTEGPRNDVADLPEDLNFGGKIFTIRSIVQNAAAREFEAALNGSVIDQAVYNKNRALEETYGCLILNNETVGNTNTDQMLQEISAMVSAGTYENQILVTAGYRMCSLAINGLLADIYTMDAIDVGKDYYSQGYNEALSIGESQYLITGKLSMSYYRYMLVMFYNRTLFSDFGVEDPQELVFAQEWTMEKAAEIAQQIYQDNGNPETNIYGYVGFVGGDSSQTDGFMSATDMRVLSKDETNYYRLDINQNRFSGAIDQILRLLYSEGSYVSTSIGNETVQNRFTAGTAGMMAFRLYVVENSDMVGLGNTGLGYGILPLPKQDTVQEDYISYVQDQCFLFGFPSSLTEEEKQLVGLFFEAFASDTYAVVKSVYYEKALTTRYLDEPSTRIMEIIDTNVYVDPINVYLTTAFYFTTGRLRQIYGDPDQYSIASILATYVTSGRLQQEIDDLNETYQSIANGTFEASE